MESNGCVADLQGYGYDSEEVAPAVPQAPARSSQGHSRTRAMDFNGEVHNGETNGMMADGTPVPSKGILRASSEMPIATARQGRRTERKAKTPDVSNEQDDKKKRGKSPFKSVPFLLICFDLLPRVIRWCSGTCDWFYRIIIHFRDSFFASSFQTHFSDCLRIRLIKRLVRTAINSWRSIKKDQKKKTPKKPRLGMN